MGKRNGNKYIVSLILGNEMEKIYPFPDENYGKTSISLPDSGGKWDSSPSLLAVFQKLRANSRPGHMFALCSYKPSYISLLSPLICCCVCAI